MGRDLQEDGKTVMACERNAPGRNSGKNWREEVCQKDGRKRGLGQ